MPQAGDAELQVIKWKAFSTADLALLGTLGALLPALGELTLRAGVELTLPERLARLRASRGAPTVELFDSTVGPGGVQRLAEGLGAGALPAVTFIQLTNMHVGDAGASALAGALGRGALPQLKTLYLTRAVITDAGLVALAPALRRLPVLKTLYLTNNPFGDEGLAAVVAPPPAAGALSPPTGVLAKLEDLNLNGTQVSDAGCATLASALDSGALPAINHINLFRIPASAAAKAGVIVLRGYTTI